MLLLALGALVIAIIADLRAAPSARELEFAAAVVVAWLILLATMPELLWSDRQVGTVTGALAVVALCTGLALALVLVSRRGAIGLIALLPFAVVAWPEFALHTKWSLVAAVVGTALALGALRLPSRTDGQRDLMRVGLSLLTLIPGISGGSETYARELARALARTGAHEYVALVPPLAPDAGDGLRTIVADDYPSSATTAGRLRAMAAATIRPAPLQALLGDVDIVHYPLTVPVPRPWKPHVITLHDVQHLDLPELFPRSERLFRKLAYDRASRQATEVIVVSEFVRGRVIELLGIDPAHVHAVWSGVDHGRFTPTPEVERESFLLYPARPWPHKNHARLLEAFREVRRRRPELRLLFTGVGHDRRSLPDGVEARSVSGAELVELYRRAACVVFPSLYEGFGLPPVEAMACGCPVAAAAAGSLPEVCGDAAVLFDPLDPGAIAAGIDEALTRSAELSERGLRRAATFTWDKTARAHDRIYASLS